MTVQPGGPQRGFRLRRRPRPKPKPRPRPRPKPPGTVDKGHVAPGGTTTSTSTTTATTGIPPDTAGQLAQDAGQLQAEQEAAGAYEAQQAMVTTPTTTAPANASQDAAQDRSNSALASFFSTGPGDAQQYRQGPTYAYEVAAGTGPGGGAENNPT